MFKKLFLSLTVITLSTLTSFPTFADILSKTDNISNHEFRYIEFKENLNTVEKLNKRIKTNDITVKNTNNSSTTDSNTTTTKENINQGYISNFIMESTAYTGDTIAADTGGAIQGNIIDLYLNSYEECMNWGRQNVSVYLIAYPGQW